MKRTLAGTCLAAFAAFGLSVSAQTPSQQPTTPRPDASAPAVSLDREVKLTGCLKAGAAPGTFELANVKKDKAAKPMADAAGTSQTPPAATQAPKQEAMANAGMAKNVTLSAGAGVELAPHVNHQIEVAGSYSAAAGADAAAAKGKTFNVTSAKMLSASCTTGTN